MRLKTPTGFGENIERRIVIETRKLTVCTTVISILKFGQFTTQTCRNPSAEQPHKRYKKSKLSGKRREAGNRTATGLTSQIVNIFQFGKIEFFQIEHSHHRHLTRSANCYFALQCIVNFEIYYNYPQYQFHRWDAHIHNQADMDLPEQR
ncbi:hypothetical protein C6502_01350 [Candidatus Poribacteria bacterium]|nr:MAG: hypothetical protein C6502_01350 [Candidatus Poribacteria bacterium]